eukprot:g8644.t1
MKLLSTAFASAAALQFLSRGAVAVDSQTWHLPPATSGDTDTAPSFPPLLSRPQQLFVAKQLALLAEDHAFYQSCFDVMATLGESNMTPTASGDEQEGAGSFSASSAAAPAGRVVAASVQERPQTRGFFQWLMGKDEEAEEKQRLAVAKERELRFEHAIKSRMLPPVKKMLQAVATAKKDIEQKLVGQSEFATVTALGEAIYGKVQELARSGKMPNAQVETVDLAKDLKNVASELEVRQLLVIEAAAGGRVERTLTDFALFRDILAQREAIGKLQQERRRQRTRLFLEDDYTEEEQEGLREKYYELFPEDDDEDEEVDDEMSGNSSPAGSCPDEEDGASTDGEDFASADDGGAENQEGDAGLVQGAGAGGVLGAGAGAAVIGAASSAVAEGPLTTAVEQEEERDPTTATGASILSKRQRRRQSKKDRKKRLAQERAGNRGKPSFEPKARASEQPAAPGKMKNVRKHHIQKGGNGAGGGKKRKAEALRGKNQARKGNKRSRR